jgi:hypothetical protein
MGKDFIKFMVLVVILYLGFLTTFSLIGRDTFTLQQMTWILTKIFFGSSYVGFDIMDEIDTVFGPPLMLIFIMLSSILLTGSLTGMLSNSFSRVISHAREEYLYVYSVYVLEASTSNRLTHFYPPFNLIALIIFRPLRLFLPSDNKFRAARILLLKATHLPIVAAIQLYEYIRAKVGEKNTGFAGTRHSTIAGGTATVANVTPKRTTAPALSRPALRAHASSTYSPGQATAREAAIGRSHSETSATNLRRARTAPEAIMDSTEQVEEEDSGMDAPTDVEVRIAELSSKIDKLTDLVLALQAQNELK